MNQLWFRPLVWIDYRLAVLFTVIIPAILLAVTIYCPLGAISTLPFLSCAMSGELLNSPYCQVWQEAPWQFREIFHSEATANVLGFFGLVGLSFYTLYFAHFLLIRLGKQGRSALQ